MYKNWIEEKRSFILWERWGLEKKSRLTGKSKDQARNLKDYLYNCYHWTLFSKIIKGKRINKFENIICETCKNISK